MNQLEFWQILTSSVLGIVIGFLIGLTGVGGGALVLPALTEILCVSPTVAVGTASLYASVTKIFAVWEHWKLRTIDLFVSGIFLSGAIPGCLIASLFVNHLNSQTTTEERATFESYLKYIISLVIIFAASILLRNFMIAPKKKKEMEKLAGQINEKNIVSHSKAKLLMGVFFGVLIGITVGVSSVGGGSLIIPVLILFFKLNAVRTVGSSIFIAVLLTIITTLIYGKGGQIHYAFAGIMAGGSIVGVLFGSRMSAKLADRMLEGLVVCLVLGAGIFMVIRNLMA